jgi:hypothetical protein
LAVGLLLAAAIGLIFLVNSDGSDGNSDAAQTAAGNAGAGAKQSPTQGTTAQTGGADRHRRRGHTRGGPLNVFRPKIINRVDPGVSSTVMPRITNGWTAQDRYRTTTVAAGRGSSPSTGLFAIYRLRLRPFDQSTKLVEVPNAGTIRIIDAPTGRKNATRAQKLGQLEFTSSKGVSGTLHLQDDTATVNP